MPPNKWPPEKRRALDEQIRANRDSADRAARDFLCLAGVMRRACLYACFDGRDRQPYGSFVQYLQERVGLSRKEAQRVESLLDGIDRFGLDKPTAMSIPPSSLEKIVKKAKRENLTRAGIVELIARVEGSGLVDGMLAGPPAARLPDDSTDGLTADADEAATASTGLSAPISEPGVPEADVEGQPALLDVMVRRAMLERDDGKRLTQSPGWLRPRRPYRLVLPVEFDHATLAINALLRSLAGLERLACSSPDDDRFNATAHNTAADWIAAVAVVLATLAGNYLDPSLQYDESFSKECFETLGLAIDERTRSIQARTLLVALARMEGLPQDLIDGLEAALDEAADPKPKDLTF